MVGVSGEGEKLGRGGQAGGWIRHWKGAGDILLPDPMLGQSQQPTAALAMAGGQ